MSIKEALLRTKLYQHMKYRFDPVDFLIIKIRQISVGIKEFYNEKSPP